MLHSCSRTGSLYPELFAVESWDTGRGGNVMMLLVYAEGKKPNLMGSLNGAIVLKSLGWCWEDTFREGDWVTFGADEWWWGKTEIKRIIVKTKVEASDVSEESLTVDGQWRERYRGISWSRRWVNRQWICYITQYDIASSILSSEKLLGWMGKGSTGKCCACKEVAAMLICSRWMSIGVKFPLLGMLL